MQNNKFSFKNSSHYFLKIFRNNRFQHVKKIMVANYFVTSSSHVSMAVIVSQYYVFVYDSPRKAKHHFSFLKATLSERAGSAAYIPAGVCVVCAKNRAPRTVIFARAWLLCAWCGLCVRATCSDVSHTRHTSCRIKARACALPLHYSTCLLTVVSRLSMFLRCPAKRPWRMRWKS